MSNSTEDDSVVKSDIHFSAIGGNSLFKKNDFKNVLISFVSGLMGAMIFVVLQNHIYAKTYGVVQLNNLLTQHIKEYSEKNIDKEKIAEVTAKYAAALEQSIKDLESKNIVLLVDAAVITKLPDYTDYLKAEIDRKLGAQ